MLIELLVLSIIAAALIFSLVYANIAASTIAGSDDPNLKTAHKYLTWVSVLGWISIAIVVIIFILIVVVGEELILLVAGMVIDGILLTLLIISLSIGVMSVLSSVKIGDSDAYQDPDNADHSKAVTGKNDCIISSVASLGSVGALIGMLIIYYGNKQRVKHKNKVRDSNVNKIKTKAVLEKLVEEEGGMLPVQHSNKEGYFPSNNE